jgi:hypothetical protein
VPVESKLPDWVERWCNVFLGAEPAEVLFDVTHLSEVIGLRLDDGRQVVVKRRPDESGRTRTCVTAQRLLAEGGFPCPLPLTEVIVGDGLAVHAEVLVESGEIETDDAPAAAARSAALLAGVVTRLKTFGLDPPLPNPDWVRWDSPPERHETSAVPGWLEDTSRRVQAKLAGSDLSSVMGHADWEAQNMRWQDDEAVAVHDWDSLAWLPEAALAGTAAGVFSSHGRPTLAPVESSEAFLLAYERERGRRFTCYESEIAWAASIWVALHNARDELVYNRPYLSLRRLRAQQVERLARARA